VSLHRLASGRLVRTWDDRLLAEELVSEAFARAYASWRRVCRHPVPQAWVVRTALNLHVSRRRRREAGWDDRNLPDRMAVEPVADGDTAAFAALRTLPVRPADLALKEQALGSATPPDVPHGRYQPSDQLLALLEALWPSQALSVRVCEPPREPRRRAVRCRA
jgi:DNA-directed RNA polymerase specialized sigma24 family protein